MTKEQKQQNIKRHFRNKKALEQKLEAIAKKLENGDSVLEGQCEFFVPVVEKSEQEITDLEDTEREKTGKIIREDTEVRTAEKLLDDERIDIEGSDLSKIDESPETDLQLFEREIFDNEQQSEQAAEAASVPIKFKSSEELLKAYNALEREFTKRCQRLKEVLAEVNRLREAQVLANKVEVPIVSGAEKQIEKIATHSYAEDNGRTVGNLHSQFLELMEDEEFLDSVVIDNPRIRAKIIEGYLRTLEGARPAKVIGGYGGRTALSPQARPKTLEEAKRLAELLIR